MARPVITAVFAVAALGLAVAILGALPLHTVSTVDRLCADSPTPKLCAKVERAAGAPAAPDLQPWDLTPADAPERPLVAGQQAIASRDYITAWKACRALAELPGPDQVAGLTCQAQAALGMHWPMRAVNLARRAVLLHEDADTLGVLAESHIADGDCRQARPVLLRLLELRPGDAKAEEALHNTCNSDLPGKPDLTEHMDEPRVLSVACGVLPWGA